MRYEYTFDLPVKYKGLELHPVTMKNYYMLSALIQCLMIERALDPNPMVALTMTRLDYLLYKSEVIVISGKKTFSQESPANYFVNLLALVTKDTSDEFSVSFGKNKMGKSVFTYKDVEYDNSDFEKIREIIAEQNSIDLPDESIQKNVRDEMEEARRYKQRVRGNKMAPLEEQMIALSLFSGISLEKIYEMTIRKFILSVQRATHMIYQNAYLNASLSGMVEFKDKSIIKSWLSELDDNSDNSDITMDVDEVQDKISGTN